LAFALVLLGATLLVVHIRPTALVPGFVVTPPTHGLAGARLLAAFLLALLVLAFVVRHVLASYPAEYPAGSLLNAREFRKIGFHARISAPKTKLCG
jgi:hypothetical protein